jgi:hypothetical protein
VTNPVPSASIGTPYGKRGSWWSCDENSAGDGIHTGVDYPDPNGTKVVAARGGKVVYCNHGSAFGSHQLEILPGDGTRDFYAHMRSRAIPDGAQVETGAKVGEVGSEGNVSGPHLHFERHKVATGGWSCSIVTNPQPSIDYEATPPPPPEPEEPMPKYSRTKMTKPVKSQAGEWTTLIWDTIAAGDAGEKGEAYIVISPSVFSATLTAKLTVEGAAVSTRFVEREKGAEGWENAEEYPPVEHVTTAGTTFISDCRTQSVPKGRRLICQVRLPEGGTIEGAELNALYF